MDKSTKVIFAGLGVIMIIAVLVAFLVREDEPQQSAVVDDRSPSLSSSNIREARELQEALDSLGKYNGPMEWSYELPRKKIRLSEPIPAGTVLKITGSRWDDSGYFSIWGLDSDEVRSELVVSTTTSRDVENIRTRNDIYYFDVESDPKGKWTIEIEKLP